MTLPAGATHAPPVTASARTGTVHVTQATGIPGVASVTSTGPDGIVATYTVNFAPAASSDEFNGGTLDPKWTVVRPDPANLTVGGGSLTITPEAGDLVTTTNNAKNLVLQPALGDWTMTSKLTFSAAPNAPTQQGGIIAYQDDDNYLKFDLEAASATDIELRTSLEDSLQTNAAVSSNPIQVNQTLNSDRDERRPAGQQHDLAAHDQARLHLRDVLLARREHLGARVVDRGNPKQPQGRATRVRRRRRRPGLRSRLTTSE